MKQKPNLTLYFQLSPNITQLAESAKISRPSVYSVIYGRNCHERVIRNFNEALAELLKERMSMAKKLTKNN